MTHTKQTVYLPVKVEDELPTEMEIVTFYAKVPVINQFEKLTSEQEINFSFNGWLENDKFLIHGIGEELSEGTVTHWLKPQEGYFFTTEQLNQLLSDVIEDTLNTAAERVELIPHDVDIDLKSITNTFDITYQKHKVL